MAWCTYAGLCIQIIIALSGSYFNNFYVLYDSSEIINVNENKKSAMENNSNTLFG